MKPVVHVAALVLALGAVSATAETRDANVRAHIIPGAIRFDLPVELGKNASFSDWASAEVINIGWIGSPAGGLASGSISFTSNSNSNIDFTSVSVYDGVNRTGLQTNLGTSLTFSNIPVTGTGFSVELMGNATGAFGGEYALQGSVVPVPEPETYAMMLAGVVAVGFMAARRRRRN